MSGPGKASLGQLSRLLLVAVVLLAGGCSGSSSEADGGGSSSDGTADSYFTSPEILPGGIVAEVARLRQMNNLDIVRHEYVHLLEVEDQIRVCMSELGFEYFPAPAGKPLVPVSKMNDLFEAAAQLHPSSAEFREAYGYGVSTLEAYLHVVRPLSEEQLAYEGSLAAAAQTAYMRALQGTESDAGCVQYAEQEVGFTYTTGDEEWEAYNLAYRDALERATASEPYVVAEADWVQCAHDRGYDFAGPSEVPRHFSMQLSEILVEPGDIEIWTTGEAPPDFEELDEEASDSVYDPDVLAELQAEEIETARLLNDCDNAFVEATQEILNRLAEEELAGTPFDLGPE